MDGFEEYLPMIRRMVRAKVGYPDCEDVIMEAQIAIHRCDFREESSIKTLVYSITKKMISTYWRKESRRREVERREGVLSKIPNPGCDPLLQECMRILSDEQRRLIRLYYLEGYTDKEIGGMLNKSGRWITTKRHIALREMIRHSGRINIRRNL